MIARIRLLAAAALIWWTGHAARAGWLIEFPNVSVEAKPSRLLGYLARPDGGGPFPAVVVLHGCSGLFSLYGGVAEQLSSWGYLALVVDSFGMRSIGDNCNRQFIEQAIDAYAALRYLSHQPFVDPARIAVLGYSMGGGTVLDVVQTGFIEPLFPEKFSAAIAYYPWCRDRLPKVTAPTLILTGAADDWNPAESCREMLAQPHDGGAPIDLTVYPGAHHAFNFAEFKPGIRQFGHWLEYDEAAATNANGKLRAFLAARLGAAPTTETAKP